MSFVALIARNVLRQKTRTILTVVGIGIGVTTVVALGAITAGLRQTSAELTHAGGADFMVAQNGAADLTFSTLTTSDVVTVTGIDGVDRAWGVLLHVTRVGSTPFVFLVGAAPADIARLGLTLTSGRLPTGAGELALGDAAADTLGVEMGEALRIDGRDVAVVGTYTGGGRIEQGGGYGDLTWLQTLARKPDVVTAVYVTVDPGVPPAVVQARIEGASDRFAAISTADDYAQVDQGTKLLDAANLAISLLAVVIGAIGVMNTMIMSVFERTREIGVLRAVGWRAGRVVRMIVGESLLLCLAAAIVGSVLGVAATRAVLLVPAVGSFLAPVYTVGLFARALAVALGVALVGASYPALRAVRLSPMEALRHE